ncbi:unnamed protein product [Meganyctiphanes norvegica]|uniref:CIDE-N domain-containing protein n=1 Tax=Meganyctiphanes norvegica TaxID=48144 RepID=A0AAV2QUM1_MEGNR
MKKPVRVWSKDREKRYGVVAESLIQLKEKGANKLGLPIDCDIRVVLEDDGTVVDDAYFDILKPDMRVILLSGDEVWEPAPLQIPLTLQIATDETDGPLNEKERAVQLFQKLKQNPAVAALFSLTDLEIIKDAEVKDLELQSVKKEYAEQIQELCIEFYVKKKEEADALEFVTLLKERNNKPAK